MQIESAFDKGKSFEDALKRQGAAGDSKDLLNQLEDKMERVENLMLKDEERQQEMLKMKMEQRRARRRKMQDKLSTVQEEIRNNEAETQEKKEVALVEI